MIDPRFANTGAVPLVPGYGAQQVPVQYHHHRHHRHHKHKVRNDASPISLDESIHKVDHGHHQHQQQQQHYQHHQQNQQHQQHHQHPHHHYHMQQQNDAAPIGSGYGVPYGAAGYPQQQQFGGNSFGYANQYQGAAYGQVPYGVGPAGGQTVKNRRRHHRHHRHHTAEGINTLSAGEHDQPVPEQLIGQRSSSVLGDEGQEVRSPVPSTEDKVGDGQAIHHRRRRHHHRHHHQQQQQQHNGEQASFGHTHQSRHAHGRTSVGADGYGHINEDLIFIERGDHSPHRQEPPPGYEYKGKIEVQGINREVHSASRGAGSVPPSQPVAPPATVGPCPPGWQQMVLGAPGGPCPSGGISYTGQLIGSAGVGQTAAGGYPGMGTLGAASGYGNLGGTMPYASQCQMVADYIYGTHAGGIASGYQQATGTGYAEQYQTQQTSENIAIRPTIIEVWQKRSKSETRERSQSRSHHRSRTPAEGSSFDFERFRSEILTAIERMVPRGGTAPDIQWIGRDGGTQTEIHPSTTGEPRIEHERRPTSAGEVRVIVQPIQPVFYMPRQTGGGTPTPQISSGPAPVIHQAAAGAPTVVYVPRNVYVPVIKPVFVPRERVIVRPQVIHVARPVLVDRPVPVTQRPIIIDRERPVPVPVRGGQAAATQGSGSKVVREEYVYRDNLPVAYGGRCNEFAGGVNYGYMPTQQEHQYATSSTHEVSNIYQSQGAGINVNVPNQFQHSQTNSHHEVQQGGDESFHGSYSNLASAEHQYAGGSNNDYLATQQGQQYASSSTQETTDVYQPNQFQHSRSGSHLNLQGVGASAGAGAGSSFHGSYSNLSGVNNATAVNVGQRNQDVLRQAFQQSAQAAGVPAHCPTQIEVLDTAVNPFWQKTDQPTLIRRYGRPAFEIVHKSAEVEQQMYSELRQRESSAGLVRSASAASYGSVSGTGGNGGGIAQY